MATLSAEHATDAGDKDSRPTSGSSVANSPDTPETTPSNLPVTEDKKANQGKEVPCGPEDAVLLSQYARLFLEKSGPGSDPESLRELRSKFSHSLYRYGDEYVLKKEREDGNLATRSIQASLHLALTDQRISELEHSLNKLDAAVRNLPPDFSLEKGKMDKCCRYQPVLKRCSREEFDLYLPRGQHEATPTDERQKWPAMEVLTFDANALRLNDPAGPDTVVPFEKGPERLRIRYQPLLQHLRLVTGEETPEDTSEDPGMVFLRPFKFFVKHHETIRKSLPRLHDSLREAKESPKGKGGTLKDDMMSKGEGICNRESFLYEDLIRCLELLIEFMDIDLAPVFEMRKKISDGVLDEIEYTDLWHLFQLGDYVLSDSKPSEVFQVVKFTGGREPLVRVWSDTTTLSGVVEGFVVDCISLVFNGKELVPHLNKFRIPRFNGRRQISSLNVYPLRFSPEREEVEATRLSHGVTYLELISQPFQHMMLKGTTLDEPPQHFNAQVVVDTVLATNSVPEWRLPAKPIPESDLTLCDHRETRLPNSCVHTDGTNATGCCGSDLVFEDLRMDIREQEIYVRTTGKLNPKMPEDLATEDRVLLANWVRGFVLRSRQWVTMRVVDLSPVQFLNDFDQMILPDNHKRTIRALVEIHENSRANEVKTPVSVGGGLDLVKGKGTGLVILLHGEPGVGKTSTAECIADTTRRPLFPITCGDIGETPLEAERNLHSNFRMAQKWGCVLLLDEADVFLAKRTQMDIRQNAITSVFLRSLEYYGGILFLTTNRVGGIDPAFKSRVHVALLYRPLDLEATKKLYTVFINRTKEEQKRAGGARFTIKRKEILKFAKLHYKKLHKLKGEGIAPWNGRQIRNAFQTAIALVEHDALHSKEGDPAPALGAAQFEIVANASLQFDEYLTQAIGRGEVAMAVYDKWRADPYAGLLEATKKNGMSRDKYSEDEDSDDSSDDSSDDDLEEDEQDDDPGISKKKQAGEGANINQSKRETEAQSVEPDSDDELAQFEAFKRFQAMRKKSKMAS